MRKTKKVKVCANCLRPPKACSCRSTVWEVVENCKNCDNAVDEEWSYCPICGHELGY